MASSVDAEFPCSLTIDVPFPTPRLASIALQALRVDKELSPFVRRDFSTAAPSDANSPTAGLESVLRVEYKATTNRMLRVAVNSFMESLALIVQVMEELDTDVLEASKGS